MPSCLFLNLVAAVLRHRLFKAAWLSGTTALSACRLARRLSYPHPLLGWSTAPNHLSDDQRPHLTSALSVVDDDAAVDLPALHLGEHVVDFVEARTGHRRMDQSAGVEVQRLGHVLAGADDGATDGQTLEHDVENGRREIAGRQAVEHDGAAAPRQPDGLPEGLRVHRGNQHAVHAAGGLLHLGDHVAGAGVDDDLRTQPGGQRQLGVIDVDGHHPQPHRPRLLPGDVAETADTRDRHPLAGPGVGHLEALVDGDARAQDGRYFQRVDVVGDSWGVGGVDQHVGAEAAVDAVAAVLLLLAQRLPAGAAVFAAAAGRP